MLSDFHTLFTVGKLTPALRYYALFAKIQDGLELVIHDQK
jgi:hypothetical protein